MSADDRDSRYLIDYGADRVGLPYGDWKVWQLGPDGDSKPVDHSDSRPYIAHLRLDGGVGVDSLAWSGWAACVVIDGSMTAGPVQLDVMDFALMAPQAQSGPIKVGPSGCTLLVVFENGAAVQPAQGGPEGKPSWLRLSTRTDLFATPFFVSKIWEVGPGWEGRDVGLVPSDDLSFPIFGFAEVMPGSDPVPDHMHDGYSALYLQRGAYLGGGGPDFVAGEFEITTPAYRVSGDQRPGPDGALEIIVFDSAHGAVPRVLETSDRADAFSAVLGLQ